MFVCHFQFHNSAVIEQSCSFTVHIDDHIVACGLDLYLEIDIFMLI